MQKIIPERLRIGDEIRIVAPSLSLSLLSKENIKLATEKIESLGLKVSFGKNVFETDEFGSSSIASRVVDLHETFADKNVKMILPVIGGFNCNQLLKYLDYDLIRNNPKLLGGYSDTTALQNGIYARAGLVTFQSPAFSMFSKQKNNDYSINYFKKCFFESAQYQIKNSENWDDSQWYKDQNNYDLYKNTGYWVLQPGEARGKIIGGNLCTLNLLQGTEFMPKFEENTILFVEDDHEIKAGNFDRDLVSLIQQPGFENVRGLVIGRFQKESKINKETLTKIISTKNELKNIPVIANVDFGHTYPAFSFPIGGDCEILNSEILISW